MTIATLVLALIASPASGSGANPVILDFHASWCGPCQQMRPEVDLLIEKGYPVKSVDIDRAPSLAARYGVKSVPAFVIVDAQGNELARTKGLQPASNLATLYREAKAKAGSRLLVAEERDEMEPADDPVDAPERVEGARLPEPWESTVRIRIHGQGIIGYGSGTVIHSTEDEALILTCAHIFKIEGASRQPHPTKFPKRIDVDLFDGQLHGPQKQVHYVSSVQGQAVDYDFTIDVGLIRIRPGRKLPASRVVPPSWKPQPKMQLTTVGSSEGQDATAWTTWVVNPATMMNLGGPNEQFIECVHAPKQGRSGGGLYTTDGYVAGVCDFAEPRGNHGLYASPKSIYKMLDRNRLMALYDPAASPTRAGTLVAKGNATGRGSSPAPSTLRAQSPDRQEKAITMPDPGLFGIKGSSVANVSDRSEGRARSNWQRGASEVEIRMDPSTDDDLFDSLAPTRADELEDPPVTSPSTAPKGGGAWRAVRVP